MLTPPLNIIALSARIEITGLRLQPLSSMRVYSETDIFEWINAVPCLKVVISTIFKWSEICVYALCFMAATWFTLQTLYERQKNNYRCEK